MTPVASELVAWVDATNGIAGDMLLAALLDAGADLALVRQAVEAVVPGQVELRTEIVHRNGFRALKAQVSPAVADQPHRSWATIRQLLARAELPVPVRERSLAVFQALAAAEARAHGVDVSAVHFHEVGAWDSIADIVGVSAALHHLGVERLMVSPVALGSGRIRMAHGVMAVPGPAVLELAVGLHVVPGPGATELATPTGIALLSGATQPQQMPQMRVIRTGVGAGSKDFPTHPNVVRVVLGEGGPISTQPRKIVECNVDDLDPRLWPGILDQLLAAGADDAWLTPIVMKRGRPAHTLSVITSDPEKMAAHILELTSTLGVRHYAVDRVVLERTWRTVEVLGAPVKVKLGHCAGVIQNAEPEFRDVQAVAASCGVTERHALRLAQAAAVAAELVAGAAVRPGE